VRAAILSTFPTVAARELGTGLGDRLRGRRVSTRRFDAILRTALATRAAGW